MYSMGGAVLRADLRGVVEEAALMGQTFIGTKVYPPLPVPNRAGQYPIVKRQSGDLLRNETKVRGAGGEYSRVSRSWESDNYTCLEYGIEVPIDDSVNKDLSRFFDLEAFELRRAYEQVQLAHEIRVAASVVDRSVWNCITAAITYTTTNIATYDIGYDIDLAKNAIQSRGESIDDLTVVMSLPVFLRSRASTKLQNRIRGMLPSETILSLDTDSFARACGVKQVLVGRAAYDTTMQGVTTSMSNIWGDTYVWVGISNAGAGPEQYFNGSSAFTLFWQQDADIFQVESYREEKKRSEIIRARQFCTEKVVLANSGELVTTGYA